MTRIYITNIGYGSRGLLYRVECDGKTIASSTSTPFFDGARALADMGIYGNLEMWDHERPYPRMTGSVERVARLAISEGEGRPRMA